ncbi:unnamed protein product [Caenorhabditis auriculariae]|uniref:Protein kinase domain-containing protein n=1 Tax=Caenorhabditis auriculariae TaxID=2777116 RepID=A0A8S1HRJ4_9PELO|nr:unnamed protein product [Caenorhabditis auriculariae]
MKGGALSTFLMTKSEKVSNLTLTRFCLDAARGLDYLHEVGVLHRDVAARNCQLDEYGTLKIGGFGLSLKAYYYEISQSDVYAYGHLICEIFNNCQMPYAGMSGAKAREEILAGKILSVHGRAPEPLRVLVENRIFAFHPIYRPPMNEIVDFLDALVNCLEEANPGENGEVESALEAGNGDNLQPSNETEDVYELVDPGRTLATY